MPSFANIMKQWTPALGAAILLGAAWSMVGAQDQSKASKPAKPVEAAAAPAAVKPSEPFGDKIVSIYTKGLMGSMGHNLENVTLEAKFGKQFLVGTGVDDGGWARGLHVEIAWDEVSSVIVYDSIEQFSERIRESGQEHGGMGGADVLLPGLPGA